MPAPLDQFKSRADAYAAHCGARVRAGRLNNNMTQADLALATYAPHPATIAHWESGRQMPGPTRQFAIAAALMLPMRALWGHEADADAILEAILAERGAPADMPASEQAGMRLRAAALAAHYVSTQCQHDKHGARCKVSCPECDAPCRCWCHLAPQVGAA